MVQVRLKSVQYSEHESEPQEWRLEELRFGDTNLIVGKNSTGKSRIISILWNLAQSFQKQGKLTYQFGNYTLKFECDDDGKKICLEYLLHVSDGKITKEHLTVDGEDRIIRTGSSKPTRIWFHDTGGMVNMLPLPEQAAAISKRDTLQHGFLEPLHLWANSVRVYHFGSLLGKDSFALTIENSNSAITPNTRQLDDRDEEAVVSTFQKGARAYGDAYTKLILDDMASAGFAVEAVCTRVPENVKINSNVPVAGSLSAIAVKEIGVAGEILQNLISQGMFRTFSIIAQVNYAILSGRGSCILIDDIGEGLDFERSKKLIILLREKAIANKLQLIMTTNDHFVMNNVPLEDWCILQRKGSFVRGLTEANSATLFEEFRFVGLANSALLELDFVGSQEESSTHE